MAISELDKKLIERIKVLRDQGFTRPQIAKELNITISKLDTLVLRANLKPVSSQKISAERMSWLDKIAKQKGYKNFYAAPIGIERDRIADTATRRQTGVYEGYDAPRSEAAKAAVKRGHHTKKKTKAENRAFFQKAFRSSWLRQVKPQTDILKQVKNNVLDSKQIAKNLGMSPETLRAESTKLFDNIYTEQMKVNKNIPRADYGFLPVGKTIAEDRAALTNLLARLRKVKGFESREAETWYKLIRDAYHNKRISQKQFKEANMNVKKFFDKAHLIRKRYPNLELNLDHTLSRGMLKLFNAKKEKFLTGMPTTADFNKGLKASLDNRYKNIVSKVREGVAGAGEQKTALEKLAKDLKINLGEVSKTGKRITDMGKSIVLGTAPIEESILESLKKQNITAQKLKSIDPALAEAAGMDQYLKRAKLPEIPARTIEGIQKLFNEVLTTSEKNKTAIALGCIGKAEGGRIGYALGSATINCVNTKLTNEPVQSSMKLRATEGIGKIRGAATSFLGMLGRGGLKVAPYAALAAVGAAAEPLVKQFRNDDPSTYLSNPEQQKGMLIATLEGETPKVDEEILKWQYPGLAAATIAGTVPGAKTVFQERRGVGPRGPLPTGVGKTRAALGIKGVLGKALGASFSPLAVAATLPLTVAAQRSGGTDYGDIATDPLNWMGPAFASTGAEMASKGIKNPMLTKALRMGMSPRTLRLVSSRFGLPGLAISAGMWGYDKWKNRSINDED
jgi:hypothetical protein